MEINEFREEIDSIDSQLLALFVRRMEVSSKIADFKREKGLPIHDPVREQQKLDGLRAAVPAALADAAGALFKTLFHLSREYQARLMNGDK